MNLIHVGYYYDHVIFHDFFLFFVLNLVLVLCLDPGHLFLYLFLFPVLDHVHYGLCLDLDQNNDPILLMMNSLMTIDDYVKMMVENDHHHWIDHHNLDRNFVQPRPHYFDHKLEMIVYHSHHNPILNVYGFDHHNLDHKMMIHVDRMDVVEYLNQEVVDMDENLHY